MNFSLDNYTLSQILAQALEITYNLLQGSATDKDFFTKLAQAFGENFNVSVAKDIAQDWAKEEFKDLPTIELRAASEVNGAMGAFASATNKIYLSKEFISRNATNPETIASVLLEEIGHYIDFRINKNDSSGDEGAIFSALVRGQVLDEQQLRLLRAEDDSAKIVLDGQMLVIEQANFTGSPNDDVLPASGNGNGGDDTFVPLFGQDNVDGGAGNDLLIVNYSANTYGGSTPSTVLSVKLYLFLMESMLLQVLVDLCTHIRIAILILTASALHALNAFKLQVLTMQIGLSAALVMTL